MKKKKKKKERLTKKDKIMANRLDIKIVDLLNEERVPPVVAAVTLTTTLVNILLSQFDKENAKGFLKNVLETL